MTAASAVSTLPMQAVAIASALPFSGEGRVAPETEDPRADVRMVAAGYFETMKIPLLEGRFLDERDTADATRTAVINETMARRYFPGPQSGRSVHREPARPERGSGGGR